MFKHLTVAFRDGCCQEPHYSISFSFLQSLLIRYVNDLYLYSTFLFSLLTTQSAFLHYGFCIKPFTHTYSHLFIRSINHLHGHTKTLIAQHQEQFEVQCLFCSSIPDPVNYRAMGQINNTSRWTKQHGNNLRTF